MKNKRRELMGLVGAIGVVIAVAGFVGGFMTVQATIVWAFAAWVLGATLVMVLTDPPDKD